MIRNTLWLGEKIYGQILFIVDMKITRSLKSFLVPFHA